MSTNDYARPFYIVDPQFFETQVVYDGGPPGSHHGVGVHCVLGRYDWQHANKLESFKFICLDGVC